MKHCLLLAALAAAALPLGAADVYLDTDTTVVPSVMGLGVQWDPSDVWDLTPAQWQRTYARVDRLAPPFIRCMLGAGHYCRPAADGQLVYDWTSQGMRRLYPILDYCQRHDVQVMLGEWGAPFGWKWDDPRWSTAIGACLEQLIKVRGYTCIRYYNKINEPQGGTEIYRTWRAAQASLRAELVRRGLTPQVMLVGPDHSGSHSALDWVRYTLGDAADLMGAYETHWYAASATEIPSGQVETLMRQARQLVDVQDPHGREKLFYMGEAGTGEWLNGDSNRYIRDFVYGVFMADYAVQILRAGLAGASAWMLDDSMHQQPGSYPRGGRPSGNPKVDFNFKIWGFWNNLGTAMGKPEDEQLRPWFYTWSLLSQAFPRGARVIKVNDPRLPGVRVTAALVKERDLSLAVVNDSTAPRTVTLKLPNATGLANFAEYHYFETDRPVDAEGYPVVSQLRRDVDLRAGLTLSLPARGVLLLSTRDGGTPPTLGHGAPLPVVAVELTSPSGLLDVEAGATLALSGTAEPGTSPLTWTVSDPAVASVDARGVVTGRAPGRVKVTATAAAGPSATLDLDVTPAGLVVDTLDNWGRTSAHEGSWVFESIHTDLFAGDTSRIKRGVDRPASVTWHYTAIRDVRATVYAEGGFEGKVKLYASPDGQAWSPVAYLLETPVATTGGWSRAVCAVSTLPAGTNHLKLELRDDPKAWSPQLGEVRLHHGP